jgi:chemotaxis protein methyltransferase CheR
MTVRSECTQFLQWCLPKLQMRWTGFRRVRSQVCKRIARRIDQLGLDGFAEYRLHLESDQHEWPTLDRLCRVTISRFYRDREIFDALCRGVIPDLAHRAVDARRATVDVWSCGCASGEEPYTLAMAWAFEFSQKFPALTFRITATDSDDLMIERARRASYRESSLRDLPQRWRDLGFVVRGAEYHVVDQSAPQSAGSART